jgi:Periplasmic binding protein
VNPGHTAGSTGGKPTITVGVLTDLSGPGSNTSQFTPDGVKAGVALAASEGYNIKYVTADSGTNPTQALTAAKRLVQQDHVFAVIAESAVLFAASPYLASAGVPVIGGDYDGAEWLTTPSMFSTFPYEDFTKVSTTTGQVAKLLGGTQRRHLGLRHLALLGRHRQGLRPVGAGRRPEGRLSELQRSLRDHQRGPLRPGHEERRRGHRVPRHGHQHRPGHHRRSAPTGGSLKAPFIAEEEGDLLAGGPASIAQSKDVWGRSRPSRLWRLRTTLTSAAGEQHIVVLLEQGMTVEAHPEFPPARRFTFRPGSGMAGRCPISWWAPPGVLRRCGSIRLGSPAPLLGIGTR